MVYIFKCTGFFFISALNYVNVCITFWVICVLGLVVSTKKRSSFILRLKCDGTRTETRFRLSAKRTSPFKSAGASVQSTTGSRDVRISGSNAGYTMFRGSVKSTGYPLHSLVSPSLPFPCVTVCHHVSTGLYFRNLVHCVEYSVSADIVRVNAAADILYSCRLHAHEGGCAWRIKRSCRETRGVSDLN